MEPGLGHRLQLGLESLPRLARSGRPKWSGGLGTLGAPASVGGAAATSPAVGARGSAHVEPDCQWLGILEQRKMDPGLTPRRKEFPKAGRKSAWFASDPKIGGRVGRPKAPGGAGYCFMGRASGCGVGDKCFAVADDDVLAGERLQLAGEIAGAAVLIDAGFVVFRPKVDE
jgi:hypothetical protein